MKYSTKCEMCLAFQFMKIVDLSRYLCVDLTPLFLKILIINLTQLLWYWYNFPVWYKLQNLFRKCFRPYLRQSSIQECAEL